jgi:hypothetical protein
MAIDEPRIVKISGLMKRLDRIDHLRLLDVVAVAARRDGKLRCDGARANGTRDADKTGSAELVATKQVGMAPGDAPATK